MAKYKLVEMADMDKTGTRKVYPKNGDLSDTVYRRVYKEDEVVQQRITNERDRGCFNGYV